MSIGRRTIGPLDFFLFPWIQIWLCRFFPQQLEALGSLPKQALVPEGSRTFRALDGTTWVYLRSCLGLFSGASAFSCATQVHGCRMLLVHFDSDTLVDGWNTLRQGLARIQLRFHVRLRCRAACMGFLCVLCLAAIIIPLIFLLQPRGSRKASTQTPPNLLLASVFLGFPISRTRVGAGSHLDSCSRVWFGSQRQMQESRWRS